ncbi:MAG TPA: hypothetical protein VFW92_01405 [Candidatus Limnocylindrales bacterium]|nr:hypothetical protein [Candidatus Limnocylindrales bacterium]
MANAEEVVERLEVLGARYLWIAYHNYSGLTQAKAVPHSRFAEVASSGVSFARANWDFAITDEQVTHPGYGADSGDFRLLPDPEAIAAVGYREGVAQAYGWLADESGAPWAGDPRARLRHQAACLGERGYAARLGFEAEFMLVRPGGSGPPAAAEDGRMFTIDGLESRWSLWEGLLAACATGGLGVHQLAKEYGPGQYELSLLPAEPVAAVDAYLLARQTVKAMARDAGLIATFMPRPWSTLPGNGLHVHLSLVDATGHEVLPDAHADDELTPVGQAAVAGILDHADGLAALAAPTPNSYRRLVPGSWAPAHVCWAFGNRAALVRIPGRGAGRHIEYRMGDASANPYLLATGLLAAVVDGLARPPILPPQASLDIGHLSDDDAVRLGHRRLPTNPAAALDALAADPTLGAALGPIIADHYERVKRFESGLFDASQDGVTSDEVSEWERAAYLEAI